MVSEPLIVPGSRADCSGEFAHLFYVLLQARGIRARYIWNSEDHVWSEYWSPTLKHWVHVDSWYALSSRVMNGTSTDYGL